MPIDLKWIRNNPDLVRTWQEQRGLSTENVDRVLDLDYRCRTLLKQLENERAKLKKLQKSMRPSNTNKNDDSDCIKKSREEILQERKLIEGSIKQAEKEWKAASKETLQALWCIASPVDEQVSGSFKKEESAAFDSKSGDSVGIHGRAKEKLPKFDFTMGSGVDLAHAFLSMARRRFAMYPIYKFPTTVSVSKAIASNDELSVESDHALAMCGRCNADTIGDDFCKQSPSMIPGWLGMVTRRFPPKSIFGAKQLPRFVSIWGHSTTADCPTDTFEIIAMTAGTVWDSRSVQLRLLEEMELFYRDLVLRKSNNGNSRASTTKYIEVAEATTRVALPANQLEMHELSRIILRTQPNTAGDGDGGRPLGYVSNYGDSVSRANEIQFLGGGLQKKGKEYVHFVRAVVLTSSIIATLLEANISDDVMKIPNSLVSLLPWTESNDDNNDGDDDEITNRLSLPLKSLLKQDRSSIFGQVKHSQTSSQKLSARTAKFAPLDLRQTDAHYPQSCQEKMKHEALSCPFDFLFPQ